VKADPVRAAAIAAAADAGWCFAVKQFKRLHGSKFAVGVGAQLEWTKLHQQFQAEFEEPLENVITSAKLDAEAVMGGLMLGDPRSPHGVTPLAEDAWLPLRAFVEYQAFERLMKRPVP
jgi:hypothetical protein